MISNLPDEAKLVLFVIALASFASFLWKLNRYVGKKDSE
jgi:hypothetical protein